MNRSLLVAAAPWIIGIAVITAYISAFLIFVAAVKAARWADDHIADDEAERADIDAWEAEINGHPSAAQLEDDS